MTTCNACGHVWGYSIDNGDPVTAQDIDVLVNAVAASDVRTIVNTWLIESRQANNSWDVRTQRTERHYQITSAALRLAEAAARADDADEFARMVLALVIDDTAVISPAFVVGETLALLTLPEARRLAEVATQLAVGDEADLAAVLARSAA